MKNKKGKTQRDCDNCGKEYLADNRNLKRGWGLCCSKSCAAKNREKSNPNYNPERVKVNNERRANWNNKEQSAFYDDDQSWEAHKHCGLY